MNKATPNPTSEQPSEEIFSAQNVRFDHFSNRAYPFMGTVRTPIQHFIGIDLHSDNIVVSVLTTVFDPMNQQLHGRTVKTFKVDTRFEASSRVEHALEPYCDGINHLAVVEATYNWYWLADLFEKRRWTLQLADPCTVSQRQIKHANDETDAWYLAERLRTNSLKTAEIMGRYSRSLRDLNRYRMRLVQDCARIKIILINQIMNHLSVRVSVNKLSGAARKFLDAMKCDKNTNISSREIIRPVIDIYVKDENTKWIFCDELARVIDLEDRIEALSSRIMKCTTDLPYVKPLLSILGCGPVLSRIIACEIGDINRFKSQKHFQSYCRLASTSRLSNGKSKGEGNAKNGNAYLSWALTELANLMIRFNKDVERVYSRLLARSGGLRVKAIRSLAAKISRAIYQMLKHDENFDVKRAFGH